MDKLREYGSIVLMIVGMLLLLALAIWLEAARHAFYQWLWGAF